MDCSLPGSSTHGIFQARVLEWGAIAFSDIYVYIYTNTHLPLYMYIHTDTHTYRLLLVAQLCTNLCDPMDYSTPGFTVSQSLLRLTSVESMMPSNQLILCCYLFLLPSVFPSIRVFSNESVLCIKWPKYWGFSISASNEYSELISFRIDWLDLLAVQGTVKSLLQHNSTKALIFRTQPFLWPNSPICTRLLEKP